MGSPVVCPEELLAAARGLRAERRRLMAQSGGRRLQERAVQALAALADCWRDPAYPIRRTAERENAGFPFPMVWTSLEALLDSFDQKALWQLIRAERVEGRAGPELMGHVIAANTPLIAWTSIARALLVGSSSMIKLPSHPVAAWAGYFLDSLADVDSDLPGLLQLMKWKGGSSYLDQALCISCDGIMAYGSDETINALGAVMPEGKVFAGYGHRVSFGIVADGARYSQAAKGFARDILLYDQGGCLSAHSIFVEGSLDDALGFADRLARALAKAGDLPDCRWPELCKCPGRSASVRKQRSLARMEPAARVWEDPCLRWTVAVAATPAFRASQTHGVVYIVPLDGNKITDVLAGIRNFQGAAVAEAAGQDLSRWRECLADCGVTYVCEPGELQRPPLSWRQNGWPVLRTFWKDYRDGV